MWLTGVVALSASLGTWVLARAIPRLTGDPATRPFWEAVNEAFHVGHEWNVPTWLASMLWAAFGMAAWFLAAHFPQRRWWWRSLALVGFMASVDEYLLLHDRLSGPSSALERVLGIDLGGATWVLVGGIVAAGVALGMARLVWELPWVVRRELILGAALFIAGSIGFEVIGNLLFEAGRSTFGLLATHVEEALEFAGVIIAFQALTRLMPGGGSGAINYLPTAIRA